MMITDLLGRPYKAEHLYELSNRIYSDGLSELDILDIHDVLTELGGILESLESLYTEKSIEGLAEAILEDNLTHDDRGDIYALLLHLVGQPSSPTK